MALTADKTSAEGFGGRRAGGGELVTLLSRQAGTSLAEQHSLMTFSEASYSLPRKMSGTLVCLRPSSNRYLQWGGENESPYGFLE